MESIASDAEEGARPIIHFDTHGSKEYGIQVVDSDEFIPWLKICDSILEINIHTRNNLCVISAACFSLHLVYEIDINRECPFYLMIAPHDIVTFGFIEDTTVAFYKKVFMESDLIAAYEEHFKPDLSLIHSEQMLAMTLTRYFQHRCMGDGGRVRREGLLTQAVNLGLAPNRHAKRAVRQIAKVKTRPSQQIIDRYASSFLLREAILISTI